MITPLVLLFAIAGFLASFALHIIIWRIFKPQKQLFLLAVVFLLAPILAYMILFFFSQLIRFSQANISNHVSDLCFILLLHIGFSLAYIMTYPTIQADCPTLKIILAVCESMPEGLSADSITAIFSENMLLAERVDDLLKEGLAFLKNGQLRVSLKGKLLVSLFLAYRNLLGLPLGEG